MSSNHKTRIVLKNVRGSYVTLTAQQLEKKQKKLDGQGRGEKAFPSIQLIIPKDHPQIAELNEVISQAVQKGRSAGKLPANENAKLKLPLRDGDELTESGESRGEAFEGCYFINTYNRGDHPPGLLNRYKETPTQADIDEYCYSGAYFHIAVNFYAFSHPEKKGVAACPDNIMFYKKGEPLVNSDTSDFDQLEVEEVEDLDDL